MKILDIFCGPELHRVNSNTYNFEERFAVPADQLMAHRQYTARMLNDPMNKAAHGMDYNVWFSAVTPGERGLNSRPLSPYMTEVKLFLLDKDGDPIKDASDSYGVNDDGFILKSIVYAIPYIGNITRYREVGYFKPKAPEVPDARIYPIGDTTFLPPKPN